MEDARFLFINIPIVRKSNGAVNIHDRKGQNLIDSIQAEQIVEVLKRRWKGEELPSQFPAIKLKGVLGSLGKKQGFGMMADRAITGRVARLIKSGILWVYKYHNG